MKKWLRKYRFLVLALIMLLSLPVSEIVRNAKNEQAMQYLYERNWQGHCFEVSCYPEDLEQGLLKRLEVSAEYQEYAELPNYEESEVLDVNQEFVSRTYFWNTFAVYPEIDCDTDNLTLDHAYIYYARFGEFGHGLGMVIPQTVYELTEWEKYLRPTGYQVDHIVFKTEQKIGSTNFEFQANINYAKCELDSITVSVK